MKEIINITDIIEYLFCPRKVYLRRVKGIRGPFTKPMLLGSLRHKILDLFNKNESALVSSINQKINEKELYEKYKILLNEITDEVFQRNSKMVYSYKINQLDFFEDLLDYLDKDLKLRIENIIKTINLGFLGKELWRNLSPKYLTEFKIESVELGLRGRVDRIKFQGIIIPYEIKSRKGIFDSDKLQLAGYSLLLEKEFGKDIKKGVIETLDETREIEITPDLKARVLEIAEEIRQIDKAMMPSNFNKCKPCSLKQECLDID